MYIIYFRVIQFSHPVCNIIMLVGVIICLASVILLGLDGQFVAPEMYQYVCQGRVWLLSIGFTLGYGAMFSKVWRVHRLTTKTNKNTLKVVTILVITNVFNKSILLLKLFLVFLIIYYRKNFNRGNCIPW